MHVLAINCGSSSLKCALIGAGDNARLLDVRVEGISGQCRILVDGAARDLPAGTDLESALQYALAEVRASCSGGSQPSAVVHRIVHGGERFLQPTLMDGNAAAAIEALSALAPLHNPPALAALRVVRQSFPEVPQVAVFDTAFHATLPARARHYALPAELAARLGIRRYGFHGTSHAYVMSTVAAHLRTTPQQLRIVSCHLGNGASVAAIEYGRSVETSMGMTPLEGLVMGSRAGDLDPGVILQLLRSGGFDAAGLDALLNGAAGLKGLTGTHDMRDIEQRAAQGDEACRLAMTLYAHRVRKYVGAYAAVMGGVDVIAFTAGIGEHSALLRHRIGQRLEFLGAKIDEDRNRDARVDRNPVAEISEEGSRTRLLVVRTDEELAMVREAAPLLAGRAHIHAGAPRIPVAVSARHAHLTQATLECLFGPGYQLGSRQALSQPGQFSALETVTLIGPRGRLEKVRVMGPPRSENQVEISRSDEFLLGIDAPVRISGDVANTPGITLEGPHGRITIPNGVICARRHIHMNPEDAMRFGVRDHDLVEVRIDSEGRDLVFGDVMVRVSPQFELEMHLDTDEANAAGIDPGQAGELITSTTLTASLAARRTVT